MCAAEGSCVEKVREEREGERNRQEMADEGFSTVHFPLNQIYFRKCARSARLVRDLSYGK